MRASVEQAYIIILEYGLLCADDRNTREYKMVFLHNNLSPGTVSRGNPA
ncbi:hypothetical protein Z949_3058 [Sulfitobacter guttiformis KCTC 32187]|nr:hypothetical protein Z949_3058 [Sulfitobacter guttiformis KCTC 32187]